MMGWDTGIVQKVTNGIAAALGRISRARQELGATVIAKLTVDTCGFSRGAAAARHCVHRVLHGLPEQYGAGTADGKPLRQRLLGSGIRVEVVEVCAVGVFDTVASYGLSVSGEGGDYAATTAMLHLDAIREAQAVYHLAAAG